MTADRDPFVAFAPSPGTAPDRVHRGDVVDSTAIEMFEEPVSAPVKEEGIVLVEDGSASMLDVIKEPGETLAGLPSRSKAAAATVAAGGVVSRLQASMKASNFSLGFVAFNERVTVNRPIAPLLQIPATDDFDPTAAGTGGTCIYAGLEAAYDQIVQWRQTRQGTLHVSNVVLVMSDGLCSDPARTLAAASRVKELPNVTLAACLFTGVGEPAQGADLLQAIATAPKFYKTVFGAEQLREFFLASITLAGRGI